MAAGSSVEHTGHSYEGSKRRSEESEVFTAAAVPLRYMLKVLGDGRSEWLISWVSVEDEMKSSEWTL